MRLLMMFITHCSTPPTMAQIRMPKRHFFMISKSTLPCSFIPSIARPARTGIYSERMTLVTERMSERNSRSFERPMTAITRLKTVLFFTVTHPPFQAGNRKFLCRLRTSAEARRSCPCRLSRPRRELLWYRRFLSPQRAGTRL